MIKNYQPSDLTGARSYFTNFDHRIIAKQTELLTYRKKVERILKVALLTKNTVVIAASHLTNDFTYSILSENPVLLNQEIIVPALRKNVVDIEELFQEYKVDKIEKSKIIDFYKSNIQSYVRWDLVSNSEWFRKRFTDELREPNSVLRRNLGIIQGGFITDSIHKITSATEFQRDIIDDIAEELPESSLKESQKTILKDFRELLYHISGARVVNCESAIPQENYLDYSLADIKDKKIILSETEIFWKILVELVIGTLKGRLLSIDELDFLSFDKILQIRNSINQARFRDEYEKLLQLTLGKFDADSLLKNFEELMNIRENLLHTFTKVINEQLTEFVKNEKKALKNNLVGNGFSLANGIVGYAKNLSPATSALGLLKDGTETLFNLYENYTTANQLKNLDEFINTRSYLLTQKINDSQISQKSVFIDAIKVLTNAIGDSYRISMT